MFAVVPDKTVDFTLEEWKRRNTQSSESWEIQKTALAAAVGLVAIWTGIYCNASDERVQSVAFKCLSEFTASFAVNAAISGLGPSEANTLITVISPFVQLLGTIPLRILGSFFDSGAALASVASTLNAGIITFNVAAPCITVIHEAGHACASLLLFKNSFPKIALCADFTGKAKTFGWPGATLSGLGEKLGKEKAKAICSAAGPVAEAFASAVLLKSGLSLMGKWPEVARVCIVSASWSFFSLLGYARDALSGERAKGHDFSDLKKAGVHPIASMVAIAAVPAITLISHYYS